jgi:Cu2+-exporting ATPase
MRTDGTSGKKVCIHCGTPFAATPERPDFCCAGCEFVHKLIVQRGLGQFYDLQDATMFPVKSVVFQSRDYSWLDEMVKDPAIAEVTLDLQGISCIGCVWLIEKIFERRPGALAIEVDSALGRMRLRWKPGEFDVVGFAKEIQSFGYLVGPPGEAPKRGSRALVMRMGVCAALAMNAMLFTLPVYLGMEHTFQFAGLFSRVALACSTLSFLIGGTYFIGRSWQSLRRGVLHIDVPIALGLIAAYAGSVYAWRAHEQSFVYFDFVSIFTFLMLVGRWLQQLAVERNRNRLLGLRAFVKEPATRVQPGETFTIEPGQLVPVRSKLLTATGATLGLEWINGESEAQVARQGQLVPSGAVNYTQASIELEALETWEASVLSRLTEMAPRDTNRGGGLDLFLRAYIFVILAVALAGGLAWFFAGGGVMPALQVLISVLVVSCPCAAGVALPLADELAASGLRRSGVFVREHGLWARINRVRQVIFDKTGTLTLEAISLINPGALAALDEEQRGVLLRMVSQNQHPVSGALRENLMTSGVAPATLGGAVEEHVGDGLQFATAGHIWRLGRPGWAEGAAPCNRPLRGRWEESPPAPAPPAPQRPATALADAPHESEFTCDGHVLARFSFREQARADAPEEFAELRARGCDIHIISGDRRHKVEAMAAHLGIPPQNAHAEMSPVEKAAWVRGIDRRDTLMIGDGANDSLAFNASWCTGTPAVDRGLLEHKADFYFLGRGLNGVRAVLEAGRLRRRAVRAVIAFAIFYNAVTVAVSLAGRMNPLAAAVLMPVSSLISIGLVAACQEGRFLAKGRALAGWFSSARG